jgi:DNA-binding SARP family transcriptional activator/TolB-like protein
VLAVAGERGVSRDRLAGLLWGETDDKHALRSLSDALYTIRSELAPDAILGNVTDLHLNAALVQSDVQAFQRALEIGDRAAAAAVYRGPLLEGFHLPGAEPFGEWLDGARMRLATQYADALEQLALAARAAGDGAAAVVWWRRLVAEDPYNSRVALQLARDLAGAGDRGNGLQSLREHVALLRSGLEVEPDAEVLEAIEALRAGAGGRLASGAAPRAAAAAAVAPPRTADVVAGTASESQAVPPQRSSRRAPRSAVRLAVAVLAGVALFALGRFALRRFGPDAGPIVRRIAVLPLQNYTGDSSASPAVDGLTEELTGRLGNVAALEITSRTSARAFRGSGLPAAAIAESLGVDAVIEGGVVLWRGQARVTVQTIQARTDRHLGAATVELPWDSLFTVTSQLADSVLGDLRVVPTAAEQRRIRRPPYNPAVTALLRQDKWEEALALDSNDARVWAAKSLQESVLSWMPTRDPTWRAAPHVRAAREAADRALRLDSTETMAWYAHGMAANYANDLTLAERALRRAVALQPSNADARSDLAGVLALLGRTDEALAEVRHAVRLDPRMQMTRINLNWVLMVAKRWDAYDTAAAEWLRLGWPRKDLIGGSEMIVTFCRGRLREALAQVDTALDLDGKGATKAWDPMRAIVLARLGLMDSARATVRRFERLTDEVIRKFWLAWAYAWLGETERAVAAYRDSYAMGEGSLQGTVLTCLSDPLRRDPRWPELLGLLNIPLPK